MLSLFIFTSTMLALAPGPDNLFVFSHALSHGLKAGLLITLGLCTGLIVHTSLVVLGLGELVGENKLVWQIIAILGACYLLYLAYLSWPKSRSTSVMSDLEKGIDVNPSESMMSDFAFYRRGIILNISNPKVVIFFIAFLPQFVQAESDLSTTLQLALLGILFIAVTLVVFGGIAVGAGALRRFAVKSSGFDFWLQRISAVIFLAIALRLFFSLF
ncbi:LysE family translocator [Sessilibacter sp. MAH1]